MIVGYQPVYYHDLRNFSTFFAEKRYKLINFAPEFEIVDKIHYRLIINKKESTSIVNK